MSRTGKIVVGLLVMGMAWFLAGFRVGQAAEGASKPNVLFLLSDDQRFDTIHALGNAEIKTPNLDRLAGQGMAFTQAFIMGSQQPAVCVPSRAMLMTGRTLFRATQSADSGLLPVNAVLLPEVFGRAGYQTIGIGKWHNERPAFNKAFKQGGSIFFGGMHAHEKSEVHDYDPSGKYFTADVKTVPVYSTELFANTAVDFLKKQKKEAPFFLYVAFTSPHDPRTPPRKYDGMYDAGRIPLPPNFIPQHPFDNGELKVRDETLLPWPRTPEAVRKELALYYGMISHLDAQIGRILEALEDQGLTENTLVVFAGDNGLSLGQHGLLGKQNLYDHSVRVPLVIAGPGVPKGKRSDALCYLLDLFPTLCELAGRSLPAAVEGKSLVPVIQGKRSQVRDTVFAAYRGAQRMVRDSQWKTIWYPQLNHWQLFNLADDPWELNDLGGSANHRARVIKMQESMMAWMKAVDDPLLKGPAVSPTAQKKKTP